jgi:sodium-dependent dicarboxylate transporter 2/3/5
LSDAADKSGLSEWIGHQLESLENLPNELILIIVMVLTALVTEVASNVACANVLLPILIALVSLHAPGQFL